MLVYPLAQQCRLLNWSNTAYSRCTGSFVYCMWVVFQELRKLFCEQWSTTSAVALNLTMLNNTSTRHAATGPHLLSIALHILGILRLLSDTEYSNPGECEEGDRRGGGDKGTRLNGSCSSFGTEVQFLEHLGNLRWNSNPRGSNIRMHSNFTRTNILQVIE